MACPCRALRALNLTRTPFSQRALLSPSYRAYSTGPSDRHPKPTEEPAASNTSPKYPPNPEDELADPDTPKRPRRRRTLAPQNTEPREKQPWQAQKDALQRKFPLGWAPPKKLSPDALSGLRALHAQFPETYTTPVLSDLFGVSPEAVRRILKSKWSPSTTEEEEDRRARWVRRGERVGERWAGLGVKVPSRWRPEGTSKWGGKVQGTQGEEVTGQGNQEGKDVDKKKDRGIRTRRRVAGRIV